MAGVIDGACAIDRPVSRGLGPTEFEIGRRALANIDREQPGIRAAYLTGSLAASLGNEASDLDLVAILEPGRERVTTKLVRIRVEGDARMPVDVQVLRWDEFRERLAAMTPTEMPLARIEEIAFAGDRAQRDVGRFLVGHDLRGGDEVADLRASFDMHRAARVVIAAQALKAASVLRDAQGASTGGDWATALASSHEALQCATVAALAQVHDFYASGKFALRRLLATDGWHDVARAIWFVTYAAVDPDGPPDVAAALVYRRLFLATEVLSSLQLGASPSLAWAAFDPSAAVGLRRSPFLTVVRATDAVALHGWTEVDASEAAAQLWLALDGRAVDALVPVAAERVGADRARRYVTANVDALSRFGALYEGV